MAEMIREWHIDVFVGGSPKNAFTGSSVIVRMTASFF